MKGLLKMLLQIYLKFGMEITDRHTPVTITTVKAIMTGSNQIWRKN